MIEWARVKAVTAKNSARSRPPTRIKPNRKDEVVVPGEDVLDAEAEERPGHVCGARGCARDVNLRPGLVDDGADDLPVPPRDGGDVTVAEGEGAEEVQAGSISVAAAGRQA